MNKVLILDCTGVDWTDRNLRMNLKADVDSIYEQVSLPLRIIRRIWYKIFPFKSIWYGKWKNRLSNYEIIIVFSSLFGPEIFSWIRKQSYKGRLILYYRDPQAATYLSNKCRADFIRKYESSVELWTFDKRDSLRYRMKYNPQFYFYCDGLLKKHVDLLYDAVYIGSTHGREDEINNIYMLLNENGINVRFWIKDENKCIKQKNVSLITTLMRYEDVLAINLKSRAIIEINQRGQTGLTLRALESLFLKKKLITNNLDIVSMDFYESQNIFVIGKDEMKRMKGFLETPFKDVNPRIVKKYSSQSWFERFLHY